jgi:hypothetical protein
MATFEYVILLVAFIIIANVLYAIINRVSTRPTKLSITEKVKLRFQIIDILKSGKYSEEELDYIMGNDKDLLKLKNEYLDKTKR